MMAGLQLLLLLPLSAANIEVHVVPGGARGAHASLAAARDAIRDARASHSNAQQKQWQQQQGEPLPPRATVHVHAGRYELAEPLVLGPQDSHTTWRRAAADSLGSTRPVHSGGRTLAGAWTVIVLRTILRIFAIHDCFRLQRSADPLLSLSPNFAFRLSNVP